MTTSTTLELFEDVLRTWVKYSRNFFNTVFRAPFIAATFLAALKRYLIKRSMTESVKKIKYAKIRQYIFAMTLIVGPILCIGYWYLLIKILII